jgi:light-independent protochlorophyllide reductase subunit B
MMGLEEHLLGMFREDFEFSGNAAASHLGHAAPMPEPEVAAVLGAAIWDADAEKELKKIPFFVRGKAKRNTEAYAAEKKLQTIKLDTLYDAKAYFSS